MTVGFTLGYSNEKSQLVTAGYFKWKISSGNIKETTTKAVKKPDRELQELLIISGL
jgi:hypothetical protein